MSLTLMTLPAEIRCMIWKFALTETIDLCCRSPPDVQTPSTDDVSETFSKIQNPRLRLLLISKSSYREIDALPSAFTFQFCQRMHLNYVVGRIVEGKSQEQLEKLLRDFKTLQFGIFVNHGVPHRIRAQPQETVEGVLAPNAVSPWGGYWYLRDLEKEARVISQRPSNRHLTLVAMSIEVTLKGWKLGTKGNPIAL